MPNRQVVSKKYPHNGGIARVEIDPGEHLFVVCSGCRTDEYRAGMAPALALLVEHFETEQPLHS